jgi:O-antigen biosynthesis protein
LTPPVVVDGKQFAAGGARFPFHGVTYGTFAPREDDGARFPTRDRIKRDFVAMRERNFTVVRTYTEPPADLLDVGADWGLRVLAGVFWPDWRYLIGASRRQAHRLARDAVVDVRAAARRLAGDERVLALCLGNEIPADVIRWYGTRSVARVITELARTVREEDPDRLVTYANYPTAEYLPLEDVDFLTFNVFLDHERDLRAYLTRLHHLAGERPLVLGEVGMPAGEGAAGEARQAAHLDRTLAAAVDRGVAGTCVFSWTDEWHVGDQPVDGWRFGLTRADRSPRPSLDVAERWNRRTVRDLRSTWPKVSVVVCAYNAGETLDECLRHTCALDYPDLEVVVVDDGSTDQTAAIAGRHQGARLVSIPHGGLGAARNAGIRAATREIVAYLDADAYPPPEWPYYLVLGFDGRTVGGVGGPNVPPVEDPRGAQVVGQSPGGPVHVLVADDRAEHVPGCNMAFWKSVLVEVGGFDPVYTTAGDDVDVCWKVLDKRWDLGFHPAALVWHHRRPGLRRYLRQQRGYGKAEALVEARHPDRFGSLGTARWQGRVYAPVRSSRFRQRVYRGIYGTAPYQSVYERCTHGADIAHQAGVPLAAVALATAPFAAGHPLLALPALAAVAFVATLFGYDVARAVPPRSIRQGRMAFRLSVAVHHLVQPLVRWWGRRSSVGVANRDLPRPVALAGPARRTPTGVVMVAEDRPRADVAAAAVDHLRHRGMRVATSTGWEDHDAVLLLGPFLVGQLVSSSHPEGCVQFRVRIRPRPARLAAVAGLVVSLAVLLPAAAPFAGAAMGAQLLREVLLARWRAPSHVARAAR